MIDVKELRIGNLIQRRGKLLLIEGFLPPIIRASHEGLLSDYITSDDQLNPIPVTPEILESCGFEKDKLNVVYGLDFGYIHYMKELDGIIYRSDYNHGMSKTFKYLHQLQNLYFALIGQELTVSSLALHQVADL